MSKVGFRCDPENPNDAILSWGDVKGNVHAVLFNSAIIALFERPPQQTTKTGTAPVDLYSLFATGILLQHTPE
jgi:hypothetical protein